MTMSQPEWPLPLGTNRDGEVYQVHRNLIIALVRAVGGAVVFTEHDLLRDNFGAVLEQVMNANGTMTLRVRENDESSL